MSKSTDRNEVAITSRGLGGAGSLPREPGELMRSTADEIGRVLDPKHAIGEPLVVGSTTIIPLLSVGFGFGAGGGGGEDPGDKGGGGSGGGGGGGGGVKPVAVVIIDEKGARLEAIPDAPSGLEKLGSAIAGVLEKRGLAEAASRPSGD